MEVSKRELTQNGYQILMRHVKPESFQQAKRLFGKMTFEDPSHVVSHFQELKGFSCTNSSQYQWFFSVKKRFDDALILTISNPICTLGTMQKQVEKILEENVFIRNNLPKINSLTCREKEIITLLVQGYNNPQISEQLYIARSTVETHRKNINKKLGFLSFFQLLRFAQAFDLV